MDHYFPAAAIEARGLPWPAASSAARGRPVLIGPSGTGKTLLCLLLAEQFRRSFQVAMLASGRLSTRRALFQAILYELGRPYRGMDEGELRLAVTDYLTHRRTAARDGMVLLVDEAHTLPLRLLEEIRLLTNLARGGQPLVRLVLAGGPVLEERLASPKLDSFSQRLSARCYLEAFNRTETQEYIQSQINSAGGRGEQIFPEAACQSVFQATGGVPRLINQVCDHALLLAYVAGRKRIEPADVEEAWADLQQLPTPWSGEPKAESAGGVIEFGALDDSAEPAQTPSRTMRRAPATVFRVAAVEEAGEGGRVPSRPSKSTASSGCWPRPTTTSSPPASIGPEVELRFEEPAHPFQEEFEHEEVVSDRYGNRAEIGSSIRCGAGVSLAREDVGEMSSADA